jgi:hypothetical protein
VAYPGLRRSSAVIVVLLAASAAQAQYFPDLVGHYGGWRFVSSPSNVRASRATATELKTIDASGQRLAAVILAAPLLNPPRGFDFSMVGALMDPDAQQARSGKTGGLPLDLWVRFRAPNYWASDGKPLLISEPMELDFYFNDLRPVILDHTGTRHWEDEQGSFYVMPQVREEIGGYPVYQDLLTVTRPGESIWAPVPVDRLMKAWLPQLKLMAGDAERERAKALKNLQGFRSAAESEKRRAELEAARAGGNADEVRKVEFFQRRDEDEIARKANPERGKSDWYFGPVDAYTQAQAWNASLSAAGRQAPACVLEPDNPLQYTMKVTAAGTAGCRPIVEPNLKIFRAGVPRGAIQVITVEGVNYCREHVKSDARQNGNPGDCNAILELVRQLDWRQVAGLLAQ